jgi:AbrB family looped-hinge helix DNA binding protein
MSTERQVYNLRVDPSGRIVLPAPTRERLHIAGGDTVIIVEDETGVHLKTRDQLLAEIQAHFAKHVPRGVSLADEINADRRSEVERDS